MKNKVVISGLLTCAILAAIGYSQSSVTAQTPAPAPAAAPTTVPAPTMGVKDAYAGKFLIGCAGDVPRGYSEAELANIKANYNVLTPENCMKPQPIHPSEDTYNFATTDALVQWCQENNVKIWGHTLLWHSQSGNWFTQGPDGQPASRELIMERLKKHITTVVGRYKGKIVGWDVCNEAINDGGDGTTENLRTGGQGIHWYRLVGPDVITMAFKWAHEADPDAQLYYNDYNIDQGAVNNTGKHASSLLLLKRLKAEGAPIHGVGIQGHWHLTTNIPDVEKAITNYAALGLKVAITELDVTATGTNSGEFPGGGGGGRGGRGTIQPDGFKMQAEIYTKLFDIFNRHTKSVDRVTLWGISDRRSWRAQQAPLLFDAQLQPKPALQAVIDVGTGKAKP